MDEREFKIARNMMFVWFGFVALMIAAITGGAIYGLYKVGQYFGVWG